MRRFLIKIVCRMHDDRIDGNSGQWNDEHPNVATDVVWIAKYLRGDEVESNHIPQLGKEELDREMGDIEDDEELNDENVYDYELFFKEYDKINKKYPNLDVEEKVRYVIIQQQKEKNLLKPLNMNYFHLTTWEDPLRLITMTMEFQ